MLPPEKAVIAFNMPIRRGQNPFRQFLFYIPGIIFILSVGNLISLEDKQACFFSNPLHPIIVADLSRNIFEMVGKHTKKAVKSAEVAEKNASGCDGRMLLGSTGAMALSS